MNDEEMDEFEEHEKLCLDGYHCSCFSFGEPCCYCDRLQGEVTDENN